MSNPNYSQAVQEGLDESNLANNFYSRTSRSDEKERQKWKEDVMSQPVSRALHPFGIAARPDLEPEVKRAILARWASDRYAVDSKPALRRPPGARHPIPVDDVLAALRSLDRPMHAPGKSRL